MLIKSSFIKSARQANLSRNSGIWLLSGFLFFGQYFDSTLTDLEGREVKYRAGIYLDLKTFDKGPILFIEDETLMSGVDGGNFKPVQINYKLGLSQRVGAFEAVLMNECKHPVDGASSGVKGQEYKLIEVRYHF